MMRFDYDVGNQGDLFPQGCYRHEISLCQQDWEESSRALEWVMFHHYMIGVYQGVTEAGVLFGYTWDWKVQILGGTLR
jgi:hypothetical protein